MSTRGKFGIVSAVTLVGLMIASILAVSKSGSSRGTLTVNMVADATDTSSLSAAADVRVFFGHQSVGANVTDGIAPLYAASGMAPVPIVELPAGTAPTLPNGGFFSHSHIGENGDPDGKLRAFDEAMRSGLADEVEVAVMKFCYVDITRDTDVEALFVAYQDTLSALERDYPRVTFLHVTAPLTTFPNLKERVKALVRGDDSSAADNAAREQFNGLMRSTYGPDQLFDLAAIESTAPDGSRLMDTKDGERYYALYDGYATDNGHLNPLASQLAAAELLDLIAKAHG